MPEETGAGRGGEAPSGAPDRGETPSGALDPGRRAVGARVASLLPRRWRQRLFEPAYQDLLAERPTAILLEARALLLLLETIRVGTWQRLRRPWDPRPTPPPGRSRARSRSALETRMDSLRQDLGQAARIATRRPTVTLVVVVTLTLGIGMNTAVFSVLYGVLYQPLPYAEPDRLVRVGRQPEGRRALNPLSPAEYRDLRPRTRQIRGLEGAVSSSMVLTDLDEPTLVQGAHTTAGYFDTLGVPPLLGRGFRQADSRPGTEPVVVLGESVWRRHFGADPDIVGATVHLSGTSHTVVGVAPASVEYRGTGLSGGEYWVPLQFTEDTLRFRHNHYLVLFGRLAEGATVESASAELAALWEEIGASEDSDRPYPNRLQAASLLEYHVAPTREPLQFLFGAVALVLLIACANVINMLLAGAEARQHELAVRAALGASRGRLVQQFLTESALLVGIGGALGVAVALAGVRGILAAFPDAVPRTAEVGLDLPVLGFALAVSALVGLALGLAPGRQTDPDIRPLKDGGRGSSNRITLFRKGLIVAQVTLALMLVVGAGLLIKSFWRVARTEPGFDPDRLLVVNTYLPRERYPESADRITFHQTLRDELEALPEVEAVATTNMVPMRSYGRNFTARVIGEPERQVTFVEWRAVSPGYFATMGIPLIRGRVFDETDPGSETPVVVINATLARRLFGDEDPLGHRVNQEGEPAIVGVVGDVRAYGPDEEPRPILYAPAGVAANLVVRGDDPVALAPRVRQLVERLDPEVAIYRMETMSDIVTDALGDRRFQLTLVLLFAAVALTLGAVGIYGVMAYATQRQMREFGIRLALGADAADVRALVLRRGGSLALLGVTLGLAGALALRRLVAELLYEVSPTDPTVYGGVAALMVLVAAASCWVPARRAASVDPVRTLRQE